MPSINRAEPYTALSDVYQVAGFADYALAIAPRLQELAFDLDWVGRTLYDMACGTGDIACWFSSHGFRSVGTDISSAMLRFGTAQANDIGVDATFVNADIRTYKPDTQVEMVTCLGGSLNYIATLRDLESVFRQAQAALAPGKLFYFDLRTIQGLAEDDEVERVVFDNGEDVLIVSRSVFNYETLQLIIQYTILRYAEPDGWQRFEETHTLRGYPVQAVTQLLGKTGFQLLQTLTPDMEPAENRRDTRQHIFVARQG
jgi:SAM-dependent methyltransferase